MGYEPQKVTSRHRVIMQLETEGKSKKDIAAYLGLSEVAVGYITNSDIYKAELRKLQNKLDERFIEDQIDVRKKIEELSRYSILEIESMLRDPELPKKLKADICFDILDREGYKAPEKKEVVINYVEHLGQAYEERRRALASQSPSSADSTTLTLPTDNQTQVSLPPSPEEDSQ